MFATIADVQERTGYVVDQKTLAIANGMVESYVGRGYFEVDNARDLDKLNRAVCYQAAFIRDNSQRVFEQVNAVTIQQNASIVTLRDELAPFYSVMALVNMRKVSWRGPRTIRVGKR